MSNSIQYVVGNTYKKLSKRQAKWDRSGSFRKVHDCVLYLDVIQGDADVIERVSFDMGSTFDPTTFHSCSPISIRRPNGSNAWRFATRQQVYGAVTATITLRGRGGSIQKLKHTLILDETAANRKPAVYSFTEERNFQPFKMLKLPETQRFGIELELTSANHVALEDVADRLERAVGYVEVSPSYGASRGTSADWKLVPDSSIVCSTSQPDCNTFEVVSPILAGGKGLGEVSKALNVLSGIRPGLKVNKSMGFHVHIDVSGLATSQLIKVCQNFIKYEDVMDEFMPLSRRNSSPECARYFQSNRGSVDGHTNRQRHARLAACSDLPSLANAMNRNGRYYKLNLQNLVSGRQPTIEFRQHSASTNYDKVGAWIRFCVTFVTQSARLAPPTPFAEHRSVSDKFHALFQYVVKDRALKDFYEKRRAELANDTDSSDGACCDECRLTGGSCARRNVTHTNGYAERY